MTTEFQHLSRFFESFISLTFWKRLFGWKIVREKSYEAFEESKMLHRLLEEKTSGLEQAQGKTEALTADLDHLRNSTATLTTEMRSTIARQTAEIAQLKERLERVNNEHGKIREENIGLKQTELERKTGHEKGLATLGAIQKRIQDEREQERQEKEEARLDRLRLMRERWTKHEEEVGHLVRNISRKHGIEYVESVPFKGNPDNTLKINDEFVVFDAKSPGKDDLKNFPQYIKAQAEAVQKYASQENVRREIFLIIPPDTVHAVSQYCYNMADYTVYTITPNSLEPIILTLKRLEEYEFVNQLSPEERENICRLIGKFAHVAKRRIQVDHFFAWQFLDILTRCESGLPREMLQQIVEFEKAEKLNPPQERRSKQILTKELEFDTKKIEKEAEAKAVALPPSVADAPDLPLFEKQTR